MKLAVIGGPGFIDRSFARSTDQLFAMTGRNTGNLVFWYAFSLHVAAASKSYFSFGFGNEAVDEIHQCDALAFIFANHVNPGMDLGPLVEKLDKIRVPILAVGLGAQSGLGQDIDRLPDGSVEFFRLLSKKTEKIGVRGDFTQSVLKRFGVENTEVLGCISNFTAMNLDASLQANPFGKVKADRIGLNNDFIDAVDPLNEMITRIFPSAVLDFIVQAPVELLHLARNEGSKIDPAYQRRLDKMVKTFSKAGYSERYILNRVYAFYDARAWLEYVRRYDLTLGSRMHGNMISFQAGVPTVFVPHDSRTEELTRTMALPRLELSECQHVQSAADFLEKIQFNRELYLDTRSEMKARYINLIQAAGLEPTKFLLGI